MLIQEKAQILWNKKVGPTYYKIGLKCTGNISKVTPGQFVMLDTSGKLSPLLRRPFSIHQLLIENDNTVGFEVLYSVIGNGTGTLSTHKKGDFIDFLGPLGNGFSVSDTLSRIFIVAGGIGVAPMIFLASHLKSINLNPSNCNVFLGSRSKEDLLCLDDFSGLNLTVSTTTEDGSFGEKGFVTAPLEVEIEKEPPDIIFACGPHGMLQAVARIAETNKLPCQVSIETIMACGMGACLGCAIEKKGISENYLHACTHGPVFDASLLKLDTI